MSFFSGVKKTVKRASKAVKKAAKQTVGNAKNINQAAALLGSVGAAPISVAAGSIGGALTAAEPVLTQATGILARNPVLTQALGAATGLPVGSFFGGTMGDGTATGSGVVGYGADTAQAEEAAKGGMSPVILIGGAIVAIGAIYFLMRK